MKNGRGFEILIESIYKQIDPTSTITRNDKVWGYDSQQDREIDLSIKSVIGIHSILIIVQAKDYSAPLDMNVIGEFIAVIKDTRANKGILISANGFTQGAKKMARSHGIELLTAHDSENPRWKLKLDIPVVLYSYNGSFDLSFKFTVNDDYIEKVVKQERQISLPNDFHYVFTPDKGQTVIIPSENFRKEYVENKLISDGALQHILYPDMDLIVEEGLYIPASEIVLNYILEKKSYYKYFPLTEFRGLIDKLSERVSLLHYKVESDEITIENNAVKGIKPFKFDKWKALDDTELFSQVLKINLFHYPKLKVGESKLTKV